MSLMRRTGGQSRPMSLGAEADSDLVRYRALLLEEIDLEELSALTEAQRRARLERVVGHLLTREGPVLSTLERSTLIRRIVDEALGLGVLEPLLADETITEIMVNGPADIWIERAGRLERVDTRFATEAQMYQTIDRIVSKVNRRVDESSPMVDARLPTGERVNIIVPPLSLSGPAMTIRRFPRAFTIDQLVDMGSLDEPMRDLLGAIVRARLNCIISGGTGTGKTTFLNALSGLIPDQERIITIEDAAELQLQQPHVLSLESRPANVEGKGQITIRDLVRNSLRMRPDRIIVGEVRGGETLDMLQAMNTGHEGSLSTVHANSSIDAITRLETLASMSELEIAFDALRDQVNSAVDIMVHLNRYADGSRRVGEIAAVSSERREAFKLQPVARFEAEPLTATREVTGRYVYVPLPPAIEERLVVAGERIPEPFLKPSGERVSAIGGRR
jgi:pilus assembly protein CpaF